jgi:hypothetical protein
VAGLQASLDPSENEKSQTKSLRFDFSYHFSLPILILIELVMNASRIVLHGLDDYLVTDYQNVPSCEHYAATQMVGYKSGMT